MRIAAYLILAIASAVALIWVREPIKVGLFTGIATALLIPLIDMIANHPYNFRLLYDCFRLRKQEVRVSLSYLIRIEQQGKYLLIQGKRYPDQYQPVGGVYKFNKSAMDNLNKLSVRADSLIPIDSVSSDDLRIRVPGKNLLTFLNWFKSGKNREVGAFREFSEELLSEGPLKAQDFLDVRFDYVKQHVNKIRFSEHAQAYELIIADIFDIVCTDAQRAEIMKLGENQDSKFICVDAERIKRRGAVSGEAHALTIAPTAQWFL
ncbi:hypothetical protein [Lentzea guizhouensis]|uniref:SMODS-associated NUDIX domain-containing protein n=1 Tax=Lentzea guizhouensis TaxID=1586287 RepID=UPI000A6E37DF|nr:hypothetical protein [Lentzea guizhouensis]